METYDKYKPSGIDWIGDVPEHWEMTRLKHLCEIYGRIGYRGYTEADLVPESEGAITLSPSNFTNGRLDYSKCSYLSWKKYYESPEIMIDNGDVIFVKTASVGKCALVTDLPKEATLNPQIVVFKKMKCNGAFLNYLCQTPVIQCQVITSLNGSTIATISQEKIGAYIFALPPLAEQEAIAAYLDARCADIDKVVATQQKRIALLQELKQSEITQAVTRGLNPDARMKDSGVEWIGCVPEHWEVMAFKFRMDINNGMDYKHIQVEEGYPVMGSGGQFACASKYLYDGEVVLLGRKGTVDKPLYFNGKFWAVDTMFYAIPIGETCCKYMYYQAITFPFSYYQTATALPSMTQSDLGDNRVCVPPLAEQETIVGYLDARCGEIDKQIGAVTKQIELLREYKQALITEVVTGKRRV